MGDTDKNVMARRRAATALGMGPVGATDAGRDLVRWWMGEAGDLAGIEGHISVDTPLMHARATVRGEATAMMGPLAEQLGLVDAPEADVARVRALGEGLEPERVSLWVEAGPAGLAVGFGMQGPFAVDKALATAPEHAARAALVRAVGLLGLARVDEVRATVGMEPAATFFRLPLGAGDAAASATALAVAIEVSPFAAALVKHLAGTGPGAALVVGLNSDGVCAFGVSCGEVSTAVVSGLVAAMPVTGATQRDDALRVAFESALGPEHGRTATLWRDADGVRVDLGYRIF